MAAKRILLELDLTQPFIEPEPEDPVAKLRSRSKPRLRATVRTLHESGRDDRVVGLIAKVGAGAPSAAVAQELRAAVEAFAASGKPSVAWADTFGESGNASLGYYLASAFGELWLQPTGELNLIGLAAEVTFLRGVLDKVGVAPLFGQRYEFKNAADRITATEFTPAHREAMDRLVESAWEQLLTGIAKSRGTDEDTVRTATDRAPLFADEALAAGLVDHLGYRHEVYDAVRRRVGPDVTLLFADRWSPHPTPVSRVRNLVAARTAPGVAVVDAFGGIVTGRSRRTAMGASMGSDTVSAAIRAAVRDDRSRALVLRVDSPGGSAVASDTIWNEVAQARAAGKPVVVSMSTVAGSGGYYIACGADVIVAQPATITGSIGVLGGKFDTTGLTDQLGLNYGAVQHGEHARMFSTHRAFSDSERARLEAWLDRVYVDFTGKVADGRGMSREAVHEVARGRVWTGADAAERGLVDTLGGLRTALRIARERAGLDESAPARPAVTLHPLARLRPPRSSEDPRAAAAVSTWTDGWGSFAGIASTLGLPSHGPLTMAGVRLR
jgi:protease-4